MVIMQHLVEDEALFKPMMEREIGAWFGSTRCKVCQLSERRLFDPGNAQRSDLTERFVSKPQVAGASEFARSAGAIVVRDLEKTPHAAVKPV